jgi:hypothetical protein
MFNINYNLLKNAKKAYTSEKYIMIEVILAMKYGWKQIPKCESDKECDYCLVSLKDTYTLELPCKHIFHQYCVLESIVDYGFRECANCNKSFTIQPKVSGIKKTNDEEHIETAQLMNDSCFYKEPLYTSDSDFEIQFDYC